jgi:hypothetical protein
MHPQDYYPQYPTPRLAAGRPEREVAAPAPRKSRPSWSNLWGLLAPSDLPKPLDRLATLVILAIVAYGVLAVIASGGLST